MNGMINPFIPEKIRKLDGVAAISYGLSSYGYDLTLASKQFQTFCHIPGTVVDPKRFNFLNLVDLPLEADRLGQFFVTRHHSYSLGYTHEKLKIPSDITAIFIGKSTYARCGIIVNTTPGEAGWEGHLTLEISNASDADCRVYANEGICQALFFKGDPCEMPYGNGKYQGQRAGVTLAKV